MSFVMARLKGGSTPPVRELPLGASQAFEAGALLLITNGTYVEVGADPALVEAVALAPCGPDTTGLVHTAVREFPPGYMQGLLALPDQEFHAEFVGSLPANPGGLYGVVRGADKKWRVDFSETTATVVKYIRPWNDGVLMRNRVFVQFPEVHPEAEV